MFLVVYLRYPTKSSRILLRPGLEPKFRDKNTQTNVNALNVTKSASTSARSTVQRFRSKAWKAKEYTLQYLHTILHMLPCCANLLPVKCNWSLQKMVRNTKAFTHQKRKLACICWQLAAKLVDLQPHRSSVATCITTGWQSEHHCWLHFPKLPTNIQ